MSDPTIPRLPETWADTRPTLHAYARALGVVARAHAPARPHWSHVSLKVRPEGLATDPMPLPDGGSLALRMNLMDHAVHIDTSRGDQLVLALTDRLSGTDFGDRLLDAIASFGLRGEYARDRFESDEEGHYDPAAAQDFWKAIVAVNGLFAGHNAHLDDNVGIVQVWPHGFDLATEWYGDGEEPWTHGGESGSSPWQINLGFYPGGDEQYFYSNPWPFHAEQLAATQLPHGAEWITEPFEGSRLSYDAVVDTPNGARMLREYARAVWEAAAPTLMKR